MVMTDYIDDVPENEITVFKERYKRTPDFSSRKCEYCEKDLTGQTSKFTSDITKNIGFQKHETKTIEYCFSCKCKRNI